MLHFIFYQFVGITSLILYIVNTLFFATLFIPFALLKLLLPFQIVKNGCNKALDSLSSCWISVNTLNLLMTRRVHVDVSGLDHLKEKEWYLVVSNHQTWTDILILQKIFNHKIPFLKFFLKKELIWMPILGLCWWALDYPFMKRYSKSFIKKYPHLEGKDIEITKKACEKYKNMPVSVMNFMEGTRFTTEKHEKQQSPYNYLLRPKAGGIAFVLASMGDHLNSILDVTIVYPQGKKSFWAFMCGKVNDVIVRVDSLDITEDMKGDYFHDPVFRSRFQDWVNTLWSRKDVKIGYLMEYARTGKLKEAYYENLVPHFPTMISSSEMPA